MLEIGKEYKLIAGAVSDTQIVTLESFNGELVNVRLANGYADVTLKPFLVDRDTYVPPGNRVVLFRYNNFEMYGILNGYTINSDRLYAQVSNGQYAEFTIPFEDLLYTRPTKTKTIRDRREREFILKQNGSIVPKGWGNGKFYYCPHCGGIKPQDSFCYGVDKASTMLCNGCCYTGKYFLCGKCGTIHPIEELAEGYETLCKKCFDIHSTACPHCGKRIMRERGFYIFGQVYCKECANNPKLFTECACCGVVLPIDKAKHLEERLLCGYCYQVSTDYKGAILPYHHLYFTAFRGNKDDLHMGVELEIDKGGQLDRHARTIWKTLGQYNAVMMQDGSLNNGFEIVSAPATYEAHKNEIRWEEAMDKAIDLGYRSHKTTTCGLHVHVDRAYFKPMPRKVYEDKFAMLFGNNADWIKAFSRRTSWNYCQIEYGAEQKTTVEDAKKGICKAKPYKGASHRVAVNYGTNKPTIEIRVFRGTLKYSTFLATLQFVQMFCDFVKHTDFEDIPTINLAQFVATANEKGFTEFISYLEERNISIEGGEEQSD